MRGAPAKPSAQRRGRIRGKNPPVHRREYFQASPTGTAPPIVRRTRSRQLCLQLRPFIPSRRFDASNENAASSGALSLRSRRFKRGLHASTQSF